MDNPSAQVLCENCGKRVQPYDTKCSHCGAELTIPQQAAPRAKRGWILFAVIAAVIGLLVFVVAGAAFFYLVGRPLLSPKTTVIYEPDRSRMPGVSPADLERTAVILKQRWKDLGNPSATFKIPANGPIIFQIPAKPDQELIARTKAPGVVEFVDFGSTILLVGSLVNTDFDVAYLPQTSGIKYHTLMTNAEIQTAAVTRDQNGNYAVSFSLTETGKKILADYSAQNIGRYLGIVLDKTVVSSPIINSPILDGNGVIAGSFTEATAQALVGYLRYEPLPIPLK